MKIKRRLKTELDEHREQAEYYESLYRFAVMERDINIEKVAELEKELEVAKEAQKILREEVENEK